MAELHTVGENKTSLTDYLSHQLCLLLLEHAVESFTSQSGHVGTTFHPGHQGADGFQRGHGSYTQLLQGDG